ncbi:MAG: glycosyltransferase family 39 protein [Ardenticatenaceae bacterium]|nr:glycosyltransferase family 39 protein [Ardenticatenaceae bacterium]
MKSHKAVLIVIGIAFIIRLSIALYSPGNPHEDFASYYNLAVNLTEGSGFSGTSGPTAFRAPGYPLFLSLFFYIFGTSLFVARMANVLLSTIVVLGTYLVSREAFSENIALISATIVAFTPSLILYTPILASENLATPLLLISIWLIILGWERTKLSYFFLAGVSMSIATLTRPGFLMFPCVIAIYMAFRKLQLALIFRYLSAFAIGLLLTLSPWVIRNYLVFGQFIPVATNGGFNLAIGFNQYSTGEYIGNVTETVLGKEYDWAAYRLKDSNLTEPDIDQALKTAALEFIKENPVRAITLSLPKLLYFYGDDVSGVYHNIAFPSRPTPNWLWKTSRWIAQLYYLIVLVLASSTLFLYKRINLYPHAVFILAVIAYWTFLHMVFFGGDRFHLPILPLLFSFSSIPIWELTTRWRKRS